MITIVEPSPGELHKMEPPMNTDPYCSRLHHKDTKKTKMHHVLARVNLRGFVSLW